VRDERSLGLPSKNPRRYAASENPSVEPDSLPKYPRIEIADLFQIANHPERIAWQPFQDGIEIHRLYGDGKSGPTAALIRFHKAGRVPAHLHTGYEHIIVLAGTQRDQNSTATAGTLMINPPGTSHSVVSEAGCIVLAIYETPVQFLPASETGVAAKPVAKTIS
jgi:quercetin dioxygenase-like cupin family protein